MSARNTPAIRGRRSITKRDRQRFLEHLSSGGTAREAARLTGRHFSSFYSLRRDDREFADAWTEAEAAGTEVLEGEAVRRAVDGYYVTREDANGNVVWREHRHDNTLLFGLLKGRKPELYASNVEVRGKVQHEIRDIRHEQGLTLGDLVKFLPGVKGLTADVVDGEATEDEPPALPRGADE